MEVCVSSVYIIFFMIMLIKNSLMFYAIKKGGKSYEHALTLMIIFDVIILLTLPLAILMTRGIC